MSKLYSVQRGDTLTAIARRFGLKSWQDLYHSPDNAAFRAKRPNPNLIFPGDIIVIPGPLPGQPPATTTEISPVSTNKLVTIEIQTAIRKVSRITIEAGEKSLQTITVDFDSKKVTETHKTGTTAVFGWNIRSSRDSFKLLKYNFA